MEKQERPEPQRPNEDELLAYLDGELEAERRAEIELMRETDWEVRADLSRVERRIQMFIEATAHQSPADIPTDEEFWQDFNHRRRGKFGDVPARPESGIDLFTAFSTRRGPFEQLREWSARAFNWQPRWPRLVAAVAVGLAAILTFNLIFFRAGQVVSAEELLRRVAQAESVRMSKIAEPAIYRKLNVSKRAAGREESVMWESWKDVKSDRFRQRVTGDRGAHFTGSGEKSVPKLMTELEHIFQANHIDARQLLSAPGYEAWRKSVQKRSEDVTEVTAPGDKAGLKLTMTTEGPHAVNAITEGSLVVRSADWHVVSQQFKVNAKDGTCEYELSEIAYEVVPLQALTVFAGMTPTTSSSSALSSDAAPASPSSPATVSPSEAALRVAEVDTLYALHQLKADLGEQIEVVRDSGGQVVARGLVETAERKRQLIDALGRIPFVATQIQTIEEVAQRKASSRLPRSPASPASMDVGGSKTVIAASGNNAFQQRLARYFVEREESPQRIQQRMAQLSNAVVSESSAALSEAWALRRLAARFAAGQEEELPSEANQRIEEMKRDHITRLKAYCRTLHTQLEPALVEMAGERAAAVDPIPELSSQAQALLIFKSVEQVNQLTHKLFAGTSAPSETPEQSARQLLNALSRLDGTLSF